jgi:lipopolysaccharide export system permease protein
LKSQYTTDGQYLAVITKNGLWIKDKVDEKILIINSSKIDQNYLIGNFITEFDNNFKSIRNIKSEKIDITSTEWIILNPKIYKKNNYKKIDSIKIQTNFDYKRIQSLYSNLSALSILELYELRKNYIRLNYSVTEVNLQILKLASFPIYLLMMVIFSGCLMLRIKYLDSSTFKISIGLFFSVIIYYINNFFYVLGSTERLSLIIAIFLPIILLIMTNSLLLNKINEK